MKNFVNFLVIFVLTVVSINLISAQTVSIEFNVKDDSGNPLKESLIIIQGITNTNFSQTKITDSNGKAIFNLNKNELFSYIIYKISYEELSGSIFTNQDKVINIVLKKLPPDRWYFYRINNGELDFSFKSLDNDTNYNPNEYIKSSIEVKNIAGKRIQLLNEKSFFRTIDADTEKVLRAWGRFDFGGGKNLTEVILKEGGWIKASLIEEKAEFCGSNIIITYNNLRIELSGSESICLEDSQSYNKIPEWILKNNYKMKLDYFYKIDNIERTISFISQPFFINNTEWKPEIISFPQTEISVEEEWVYQIKLKEYPESYSPVLNLINYALMDYPEGMSIDKDKGIVKWKPTKPGEYNVTVRAYHQYFENNSDKIAFFDQSFSLKVKQEKQNNPPIAYNINITTEENKPVTFNLNATDPENDPLTFIIVSNPSNGSISNFNSSTGEITYTPNPSFFGTDSFSFKANDGKLDSNIAIVTITVNPIPKNKPPVIKSQPVTEVNENSHYSYQVIAEDEDGDSLTYSLEAPSWLSISSTGLISGIAPEVSEDVVFDVILRVSDGKDFSEQKYQLKVVNVNKPPVIKSQPVTEVNENSHYSYQVIAEDEDGDSLTYSLEAPSWLSISSTGLISGIAPEVSEDVVFDVILRVSDGKDFSEQKYQLKVVNVNKPPVIKSQPVTEVNENSHYSYQVIAEDEDGDSLTYSLEAPSWLSISSTGLISGIAPEVSEDVVFDVILRVSDGKDFSEQKYQLKVVNVNKPPVIKSQPVTEVNENSHYSYQVIAEDEDGDSLTYSLEAPSWLSISSTGLISGIAPEVSEDVVFDVILRVSDGKDFSEQKYQLKVVNVNKPPVIKSQPVTEVNENSHYSYQVIAEDEDGDSLTYSLEAPSWLSISSTGLISGIAPEVSEDVVFDVILRVSDGKDFSEQKYQLKVVNVEKKEEKREIEEKRFSFRSVEPDDFEFNIYFNQFSLPEQKSIPISEKSTIKKSFLKEEDEEKIREIAVLFIFLNLNSALVVLFVLIKKGFIFKRAI
ncbi:MAG: hypothetical protein KatS3mg001_068 [Candidatus Pacearchaeota archaeon]|nr:MAG: hypothetical protein KatS3mg001_068 [Candidatus Pacearchaeota archaeon]